MQAASLRETINFSNNTSWVTPYNLGQVLQNFPSHTWVLNAIAEATIDPSQIDLTAYAKKTDLPSKLSQLTNDDNYVQTINGLIPINVLPSFVDDVLEYSSKSAFPNPGEAGKIYVATNTNLTYRWGGSDYVEISKSLALGTTELTAFRGDYGEIAYEHSQITGNAHNLTLSDLDITIPATTINYLNGLNRNIITALGEKLNLTGGTLTGYLTLVGDPTQKLHAATKDYVDKEIQGISVVVTQHVTQIHDLEEGLSGVSESIGSISDTLVDVDNSLTGLNQTTATHTESINTLTQDNQGIHQALGNTQASVTILESTVNQLSVDIATETLAIAIDGTKKPLITNVYNIPCDIKFRGNEVPADTVTINNQNTGITCTYDSDDKELDISVASNTAIPNNLNKIIVTFSYTSGTVTYNVVKNLYIVTVPKGEDGSGAALVSSQLYFKLVNHGAAAPSKPTHLDGTEDGWSKSEPSSLDLTKDLYSTLELAYEDDSFIYSDPSIYSVYEAAKTAYTAAQEAQQIAEGAQTVYIGVNPPEDFTKLWLDTATERPSGTENPNYNKLHKYENGDWKPIIDYSKSIEELRNEYVRDYATLSGEQDAYNNLLQAINNTVLGKNIISSDTAPTSAEDKLKFWLDTLVHQLKKWDEDLNDWVIVTPDSILATLEIHQADIKALQNAYVLDFTDETQRQAFKDNWETALETTSMINQRFKFDSNGLLISSIAGEGSTYQLQLTNQDIKILLNGTPVSTWNADGFDGKNITAESLKLKQPTNNYAFKFIYQDNGSLSFRKVSD